MALLEQQKDELADSQIHASAVMCHSDKLQAKIVSLSDSLRSSDKEIAKLEQRESATITSLSDSLRSSKVQNERLEQSASAKVQALIKLENRESATQEALVSW